MGIVAMGKIESGHIKRGSTVMIMPIKVTSIKLENYRSDGDISRRRGSSNR